MLQNFTGVVYQLVTRWLHHGWRLHLVFSAGEAQICSIRGRGECLRCAMPLERRESDGRDRGSRRLYTVETIYTVVYIVYDICGNL